jgi:hypothetical protein
VGVTANGPASELPNSTLEAVAAEIEGHVGQAGWDRGPVLFALVSSSQLVIDDPTVATVLGIDLERNGGLTPVEQEDLPEGELDEVLAQIAWPESVLGCAVSQEIVLLPPGADEELPLDGSAVAIAAAHPQRREARLLVAVLRDGASASLLRLRGTDDAPDDLLTGPQLAPNLVDALLATFED